MQIMSHLAFRSGFSLEYKKCQLYHIFWASKNFSIGSMVQIKIWTIIQCSLTNFRLPRYFWISWFSYFDRIFWKYRDRLIGDINWKFSTFFPFTTLQYELHEIWTADLTEMQYSAYHIFLPTPRRFIVISALQWSPSMSWGSHYHYSLNSIW